MDGWQRSKIRTNGYFLHWTGPSVTADTVCNITGICSIWFKDEILPQCKTGYIKKNVEMLECGQLLCWQRSVVSIVISVCSVSDARLHLLVGRKTWNLIWNMTSSIATKHFNHWKVQSLSESVRFSFGNKSRCYQPVDDSHPSRLLPPYWKACSVQKADKWKDVNNDKLKHTHTHNRHRLNIYIQRLKITWWDIIILYVPWLRLSHYLPSYLAKMKTYQERGEISRGDDRVCVIANTGTTTDRKKCKDRRCNSAYMV